MHLQAMIFNYAIVLLCLMSWKIVVNNVRSNEAMWLVVECPMLEEAKKMFVCNITKISTEGHSLNWLVSNWIRQVKVLSNIQSEPHADYAGFVTAFTHKLSFYMHVMPNLGNLIPLT